MRLDQWLWAVRLFKTRSLAAAAVKAGHVRTGGAAAKPAHQVRSGEVLMVQSELIIRTFRVLDAPRSRVGAKLVPQYLEDLTPPEELEKLRQPLPPVPGVRPKGAGRPTKRERRILDELSE